MPTEQRFKTSSAVGFVVAALALPSCLTSRPPSLETVDRTSERVERGRYLVEHAAACLECHSPRDWSLYLGTPKQEDRGSGGDALMGDGFPGQVVPPNITSDLETGIGGLTDGMVMRAIREGVSHDGRALFPYMPYPFYRSMADDDVRAVVAYLRTLPPVKRRMPVSQLDFPLSLFINFAPKPVLAPVPVPDPKDSIATGKYFVTIGGCIECHTPKDDKGRKIKGKELSGGAVYKLRTFSVEAPNLTAKPGTFVGQATRDEFIGRFKDFEGYRQAPKPAREGVNSIMPWPAYGGLTRDDLGAIYDYLKTVPPQ